MSAESFATKSVLDGLDGFVIHGANRSPGRGRLDAITVILRDQQGRGQVIVECFGMAWSCYFGSIGSKTLREFLADCDEYYLAGKLQNCNREMSKKARKTEEEYIQDISRAIISALKGGELTPT